jgi:hypothetical protein
MEESVLKKVREKARIKREFLNLMKMWASLTMKVLKDLFKLVKGA